MGRSGWWFYNRSMKSCLEKNGNKIYSAHHEGIPFVTENTTSVSELFILIN